MPPLPDDAAVDDGPDLRSTIESAIDADEGGGTEPSQPAESAPDSTPQPVEKPAGEPQIQAKGDRDSLGRFLPKGKEAPGAPGTAPGTPGPTQQANGALPPIQPAPQAPALQAPASWSPSAREHWKTVPA